MAKTNAERQREYRLRQQTADENGRRKIECYVSTGAALALKRLAHHRGMTQGEFLAWLLLGTQDVITREMTDPEHDAFFVT